MEGVQTIQIVIAVATLLLVAATLLVVWVGIKQSKAAREALSFQHRALRRPVFDAMQRFISKICTEGNVSEEDLVRYLGETKEAALIFDKTRRGVFEEVYRNAHKRQYLKGVIERPKNEEQRLSAVNEVHELGSWFSERLTKNENDFRDYLEVK